jgi:hypothetical protein
VCGRVEGLLVAFMEEEAVTVFLKGEEEESVVGGNALISGNPRLLGQKVNGE